MPRIRSIKPEFCVSEQIAECSSNARLLFVLMWCFCDDAGRHPANTKRLKMEVFPGDSFTDAEVRSFIEELIRVGLLIEYKHENTMFWEVTGWKKHQKIDRPSYKYGPLDAQGNPVNSTSVRRVFDEPSTSIRETPPPGEERKGVEGRGEEGNGVDVCGFGERSPNPPKDEVSLTEFSFVICDGSEWFLPSAKRSEYLRSFPELDIDTELRKASQWTRDNPKKRKTAKGMFAFLGAWLSRSQDRPKPSGTSQHGPSADGYFMTEARKKLHNSEVAGKNFLEKMAHLSNANGKVLDNDSK